ncbi:molybdate ABC transporter substrate-binding protein [Parafannyhessea umbonata]|nr:molybdate ABC transporter substrate-binding protein [Parafannyhessea umbonata]
MHHMVEKGGALTRRQLLGGAAALAATAALAACGSAGSAGRDGADSSASGPSKAAASGKARTLTVFAAASLTESLQQIGRLFERKHKGVTVKFNFDSSGTLCTQIAEGARADVFFSAAEKQMDQLDGGLDGQEGAGMVDHATRVDLLQNKVVLCVPKGNPKDVKSFDGLAKALAAHQVLLAMGNADVPVGQYTQRILAHYGLDEAALAQAGCISYGSNVKEVAAQVREASVDCGVVYATDAKAESLAQVDAATDAMCGRVAYPVAAVKAAPEHALAVEFVDFLRTKAAVKCFTDAGFTALAKA